MLPLIASLLIVILLLLVTYLGSLYTYWRRRGVLQETPIPPFGNFKGIGGRYHISDINRRLYNEFKNKADFAGIYLFVKKGIILLDLDLVKQILVKDFSKFRNRGMYSNAKVDPLSGHLVILDGEEWRVMRHKLTPVFTSARMKYMFSPIVKLGEHFAEVMKRQMTAGVDVKDLCARYTIDVIGNCVFGLESNCLENPNEEFRMMAMSIFTDRRHHPLIEQFIMTNPGVSKLLRLKFFKDDLTNYFLSIMKETADYRLRHNIKRNDFMDLLIELKADDTEGAKTTQSIDLSYGLTIEQMAAQAFSFLIAGFETSATTMSFCLYELARNIEIQDKLRNEILGNLKENNDVVTYEGLNSLGYLDKVVKETLRLYPPVAHLLRVSETDYQASNSSCIIPRDTLVIVPIEAIHHDPQHFEDPATFNPSRFEQSECEKRHPCAYLPFGDGPRNCIGLKFGKMQSKIGLVSLLRHFRFECCDATQVPIEIDNENFFLAAKGGIVLKIVPLPN